MKFITEKKAVTAATKVLSGSWLPQTIWPKVTATVPWHGLSEAKYTGKLKAEIQDWEAALRLNENKRSAREKQ